MLQISPTPFRSILILQTKFIGDIVLASVLAKNLQLEYPGLKIVFLSHSPGKALWLRRPALSLPVSSAVRGAWRRSARETAVDPAAAAGNSARPGPAGQAPPAGKRFRCGACGGELPWTALAAGTLRRR